MPGTGVPVHRLVADEAEPLVEAVGAASSTASCAARPRTGRRRRRDRCTPARAPGPRPWPWAAGSTPSMRKLAAPSSTSSAIGEAVDGDVGHAAERRAVVVERRPSTLGRRAAPRGRRRRRARPRSRARGCGPAASCTTATTISPRRSQSSVSSGVDGSDLHGAANRTRPTRRPMDFDLPAGARRPWPTRPPPSPPSGRRGRRSPRTAGSSATTRSSPRSWRPAAGSA